MADLRRIFLDPKKFRDARKRAGLTQQAAASKIGVGKSAICKIERGHVLPSANTLARFCILVDTNIADLTARVVRSG